MLAFAHAALRVARTSWGMAGYEDRDEDAILQLLGDGDEGGDDGGLSAKVGVLRGGEERPRMDANVQAVKMTSCISAGRLPRLAVLHTRLNHRSRRERTDPPTRPGHWTTNPITEHTTYLRYQCLEA